MGWAMGIANGSYLVMAISLTWRGDRRAMVPLARRIQRAEALGSLLAILSLLLWIFWIGASSST
jgi:hypothetical protein